MLAAKAKGKAAGGGKRGGAANDPADALLSDKRRRGMDDSDHELDRCPPDLPYQSRSCSPFGLASWIWRAPLSISFGSRRGQARV
jgi:hypothetical protein